MYSYSVITMARREGVRRAQEGLGLFSGAVEALRVAEFEEFVLLGRLRRMGMCMYRTIPCSYVLPGKEVEELIL